MGWPRARRRGARPPFFPVARTALAFGGGGRGLLSPHPGSPGPPPPAAAPAEPRNFSGAGAEVSAKCSPSCRDGAAEPARGARRGARAPPGRRPGALGRVGAAGPRRPAPHRWVCWAGGAGGAASGACPRGGEGGCCGTPLGFPSTRLSCSPARGGPGRAGGPWDLSPASSLSHWGLQDRGCRVATLREPAPGSV